MHDTGIKHTGPIAAIATFASYIATAGYDNRIILWDASTRKAIARGMHDHLVNHCCFSSDGKLLASASSDFTARIWEVPTMRLRAVLDGHTDDIDMAVFSPDDQWVATCALDRTIRIFDLTGRCQAVMTGHTGNIISVAWRQDGQTLVSSSVDGTVREWDVATGQCIHCHQDGIRTDSFAIAEDGVIYAADDQGRIVVIQSNPLEESLENTAPRMTFHPAHRAGIKKIVYDATHQRLVTISYDRTLAMWAIQPDHSVSLIRQTPYPNIIWARSAAFLSAHQIVLGTFGSTYAIYDALRDSWDLAGVEADASINAVLVSNDQQWSIGDAGVLHRNGQPVAEMGSLCNFLVAFDGLILTGGQAGQVLNANTGEAFYEHHSPLNCGAAFFRKGIPHVAIGAYTGEILVFVQPVPGQLSLETILHPFSSAVKGISASETSLFSVCAGMDIAWFDLETLSQTRWVNKAHERIANACCRADKTGFASIGRDRKLRLWLESGDECYDTPHPNSVKCICANADNTILVSGAYTGTVAAFDLKTRTWIGFDRPTDAGISSISYDQSTGLFWASSYDGKLHPLDYQREQQTLVSDMYIEGLSLEAFCMIEDRVA